MTMTTTVTTGIERWIVAFACCVVACAGTGDENGTIGEADVGGAEDAHDRAACRDAADELRERGCSLGLLPRIQLGGDPVAASRIDDVGVSVCDGLGRLVDAAAAPGEEKWVGSDIFQNSYCTIGCFVPECGRPSDVCLAGLASGGLCAAYCSDGIDAQECRRLVLECNGLEPEEVDPHDEACGLAMGEGG